ncbi:hypothetical protein BO79DRAFT_276248 [Aspergillus costaricaensis CBS 115574]|uniref:Uncharacterized protein n=1 Tax=Aspergillus costaricaensis CBS 115574 TaxID=1448317 RepID=A0ACD1I0P1_9EURO|nr:hypothetical protein BO79DRAFT_276248 [Aspergillus costaricaensis CBS 115574]RAK84092.1 hypothetical protein BO79DRAFT_276248 [Aspergillus costaricaensis CBS 115574]
MIHAYGYTDDEAGLRILVTVLRARRNTALFARSVRNKISRTPGIPNNRQPKDVVATSSANVCSSDGRPATPIYSLRRISLHLTPSCDYRPGRQK